MSGVFSFRATLRLVGLATILLVTGAAGVQAGQVMFLVRVGTDAEGNPMFRQADSRDGSVSALASIAQSSRAVQAESQYYDAVQRDKLAGALAAQGASQQQIQSALASWQPEPTFVEVNGNTSGTYNDWKGRFSVVASNGQAYSYSAPRVVFPLGSDVMRSGDTGLIEQTLVHEMGHGVMTKAMGQSRLPNTPALGQAHSGISVSDQPLAWIEGWAEFCGAYFTGRDSIAQDSANSLDNNGYAVNSNGTPKTAAQLVACEGWTATVLLQIARSGANQNAMWKMTQVMERTTPQSFLEMLAQVERANPELTPIINQTLAQTSRGQIQSPTGQTQVAGYYGQPGTSSQPGYATPPGYGTNYGAGNGYPSSGYPSNGYPSTGYPSSGSNGAPTYYGSSSAAGTNGFDGLYNRLASAMFGGSSPGSYSSYSNYYGGTPPVYAPTAGQPQAAQTIGAPGAGPGPWYAVWQSGTMSNDWQKIRSWFAGLFRTGPASTAGLQSTPQYSAGQPQSAYRMPPQMDMPAAPVGSQQVPGGVGPAGAQSYNALVDSLKSGDPGASQKALDQYRQADQQRRQQQGQTTPGQ